MTLLQRRLKGVIERWGDDVAVGGLSGKALVSVLTSDEAASYLTSAEIVAADMPIRAFTVPYDDPTASGSTLAWNGQSFAILRAIDLRLQNATVARILVGR